MNVTITFDSTISSQVAQAQAIVSLFEVTTTPAPAATVAAAASDGYPANTPLFVTTHNIPAAAPTGSRWVQQVPGGLPALIGSDGATIPVTWASATQPDGSTKLTPTLIA